MHRFEKWNVEKAKRKEKGLPAIVDYRDETYVSEPGSVERARLTLLVVIATLIAVSIPLYILTNGCMLNDGLYASDGSVLFIGPMCGKCRFDLQKRRD